MISPIQCYYRAPDAGFTCERHAYCAHRLLPPSFPAPVAASLGIQATSGAWCHLQWFPSDLKFVLGRLLHEHLVFVAHVLRRLARLEGLYDEHNALCHGVPIW